MPTIETDPIKELGDSLQGPFERAQAMPRSVYTSEAFLKAEQETIFAREWICIGRRGMWKEPGDYVTATLAGRPIVVIRNHEGALVALSNVCLHRMSTLLEGEGNINKSIVCPYHAWTYGLDGRLRGAPGMSLNEAFDKSEMCLPSLRVVDWHGWIMVTLSEDAPDPHEHFREAEELIGAYDMASYTQTFHERLNWNTNWKVLGENFMESYHLPVCHAQTIGGYVNFEEMECPPGGEAYNYHAILKDPDAPLTNAHPANTTLKGDLRRQTVLLTLYPALFITLTPGYFWYLSLQPDGPDKVNILYGGGLSPDYVNDPEAQKHFADLKKLLDEVNDEDKECTEGVYRGLCSEYAKPGPLSHLERPIWEFAQYIHKRVSGNGG